MDCVSIRGLQLSSFSTIDNWNRARVPQPIILDVECFITKLQEIDNLTSSVNYSLLNKEIHALVAESKNSQIHALSTEIAQFVLQKHKVVKKARITIKMPRALLQADYVSTDIWRGDDVASIEDVIIIRNIGLSAIIGLNPWERLEKQRLSISLTLDISKDSFNYKTICRSIEDLVSDSKFKTIELLALSIAKCCIVQCNVSKVTVCVDKPNAVMFAECASLKVTRSRLDLYEFYNLTYSPSSALQTHAAQGLVDAHVAFVAIGSNVGNRAFTIEKAIRMMCNSMKIVDSSFMYESDPMYLTTQPKFLNCVIKIVTSLDPINLLKSLQMIEQALGRDALDIRECNGPRPIDLDIIFYDQILQSEPNLIIPHPRLQERLFVLKPLVDIASEFEHPSLYRTCRQLLADLKYNSEEKDTCMKVFPIRDAIWNLDIGPTVIMGILNATPDSFSDGSNLYDDSQISVKLAVEKARSMINAGAAIIDIGFAFHSLNIGGQSTRPGAEQVLTLEEISRVIPIIKAIRSDPSIFNIPISIDTYRSEVAIKAIEAGADLINDITGGLGFVLDDKSADNGPSDMVELWGKSMCCICIMHMRGDPKTMQNLTKYDGDVVASISTSLAIRIQNAMFSGGVLRWKILADPGIGFAKTSTQNFQILKRLKEIVCENGACVGFPLLLGPSRKGFIGDAVGSSDARDEARMFGTCAACTAAVAGGCSVLRVHDVGVIKNVVDVADRCFKR